MLYSMFFFWIFFFIFGESVSYVYFLAVLVLVLWTDWMQTLMCRLRVVMPTCTCICFRYKVGYGIGMLTGLRNKLHAAHPYTSLIYTVELLSSHVLAYISVSQVLTGLTFEVMVCFRFSSGPDAAIVTI